MSREKRKVSDWCLSCKVFTEGKVLVTKPNGKQFYRFKGKTEPKPWVCLDCLYWRFCDVETGRMPRYEKGVLEEEKEE